jgi:hypothetical protein
MGGRSSSMLDVAAYIVFLLLVARSLGDTSPEVQYLDSSVSYLERMSKMSDSAPIIGNI